MGLRRIVSVLVWLSAIACAGTLLEAQGSSPRFNTVKITATSDSLCVGVAVGAACTTATGTIHTGSIVVYNAMTINGGLAVGGGTASDEGVMIPSGVPSVTTTNLHNNSGTLTWLAGTIADSVGSMATIRGGGIAIATQGAGAVPYATSNSQFGVVSGTGLLQLNGSSAPTVVSVSSPGAVLLYANSGSSAGVSATTADSYAVAASELTDLDQLLISVEISSTDNNVNSPAVYNSTSSVTYATVAENQQHHFMFFKVMKEPTRGVSTVGIKGNNGGTLSLFRLVPGGAWGAGFTLQLNYASQGGAATTWVWAIHKLVGQ